MILYLAITVLSIGTAYGIRECCGYGRGTRGRSVYILSFVLLFLLLAVPEVLRQETGNDYMRYVEFFHLAWSHAYVPTEEGFNIFVRLIYWLCGYENYLLVFALFAVMTIGFFLAGIKRLSGNFFLSFSLFMLLGFYFQSYNTVRYYFALAITLFALRYFLERQYIPFVFWILFAGLFHRSVLCVLVLYPLCRIRWKKWMAVCAAAAGIALYAFQDFWMKVIVRLYPSYEGTDILAAGGSISWANIAKCLLVLALYVLSCNGRRGHLLRDAAGAYRGLDAEDGFYLNCTMLALFIYVFGSFIPEISRIGYFLMITQVILVPDLVGRLPEKSRKKAAVWVLFCACVFFAGFLWKAGEITIRILPYKSFLFHELSQTPSRSIE